MLRDVKVDGREVWEEVLVSPVRDGSGSITHYVVVEHDMTEVKHNEVQLRASHEALDRLNRELESRVQERTRELRDMNVRLEELASTDSLTGACNRRHFLELARTELSRAKRLGLPLSVIMLDIDLFKSINDRHGHEAGDQALTRLSAEIRSALRAEDIFARLGGEEFIVMLPGQSVDEALKMAERMRALVEAIREPALPEGLTISLGVAGLAREADDVDDLLRRADQALYRAKHLGRNRVCSSPTSP
jgi:diguanylate cyclase (GGDEF)-like protein